MPTVAAVIIGNEILTGKFADENGVYLIQRCRVLGADLERVTVLADDVAEIAREVAYCAQRFDWVFTSGGVGPTHDDVTLEGVARAFERPLHQHPDLVALIDAYGLPRNDASLRMATIPQGAVLVRSDATSYPVLRVDNVWVLPGVPRLFRSKFETIAHHVRGVAVTTARLFVDQHETAIAATLGAAQDRWPMVDIGSYPRFGQGEFKVIVTLESRQPDALHACEDHLRARLDTVQLAAPDDGEDPDGGGA